MTKEFNYITWRDAYVAKSGAAADAVDYYCTILARTVGSENEHTSLERFLGSKGIAYTSGKREFKHVEALWEHLRGQGEAEASEDAPEPPVNKPSTQGSGKKRH